MYSTLIVFAGYLASDIFLDGYVAALAVFSLGFGEFLFLMVFRGKRQLSLILEGAVLAAAGLGGDRLAALGYRDAGYVILELVLAAVLLVSTAKGKPWLSTQMKKITGFSAGREFSGEMSTVMGFLFLAHGTLLAVLVILQGRVAVIPAVFSFFVLYAAALFIIRRKQREKSIRNEPRLLKGDEGKVILELAGEKLGSLVLKPGAVSIVTEVEIDGNHQAHELLTALETFLKHRGCRAVRFTVWEDDELPLEMSGYRKTPTGWNKIL